VVRHFVQDDVPTLGAILPAGHCVQEAAVVEAYFPVAQLEHVLDPVFAAYLPALQEVHFVAWTPLYLPVSQLSQAVVGLAMRRV
jgi:hypothetical protein